MIVNGIRLGSDDITRLKNSAKVAQDLENRWDLLFQQTIAHHAKLDADRVTAGSQLDPPPFENMMIEHYFRVQIEALQLAEMESELKKKPRLARQPRALSEIIRMYDRWRRGLFKPKGPVARAKELKQKYIESVQSAWKKYSHDFREGGEQTQAEIRGLIREAAKTTTARAQTIVRTETTRYYNQARKAYYDKGDEVTHYLFIAVRDKATTPWCTPGMVNGKRGRSGLVYAKGDPLLDSEMPPCHWNCRSELLPLNRFNPTHLKLINNAAIARRNHVCTPLPPGWAKSA